MPAIHDACESWNMAKSWHFVMLGRMQQGEFQRPEFAVSNKRNTIYCVLGLDFFRKLCIMAIPSNQNLYAGNRTLYVAA